MRTREIYQQLIVQCPCPVNTIKISSENESIGVYYAKRSYAPAIEIYSRRNQSEDVVNLIHEKIHADHDAKNCECMVSYDKTLAEYHAYKEGLQIILKFNSKHIIREALLLIRGQTELFQECCHKTAAKKVMKLKIWEKCENYLTQPYL